MPDEQEHGRRDPDGQQPPYGDPLPLHDLTILRGIIDLKGALMFMFFWLMILTAFVIGLSQR